MDPLERVLFFPAICMADPKRSIAAKKAALTRKRKSAGVKAAKTRKRKAAAKKAAATRKANKSM